jgi:hypothetical protein
MGLAYKDIRGLLEWRSGQSGGEVATLGRLTLTLHPKEISELRRVFANDPDALDWLDKYRYADFADEMLKQVLKFNRVTSIDLSDYEGATVVQNIGEPLQPHLIGKFDLAIDGGTLEHVFNFPVAIGNLMRLVKKGGAVYTINPCNSLAGHGFYQFSPELMYRVFSPQNGFEIQFVRIAIGRNLSIEKTPNHAVYDVVDPAKYGNRVYLASRRPAMLLVLAVKRSEVEPFTEPVLQSDYLRKWDTAARSALNWKGKLVESVGRSFPFITRMLSGYVERREASVRNVNAYTRRPR